MSLVCIRSLIPCILLTHSSPEELTSKKRFSDAATVLLDYADDVRQAVIALVEGSHFSEARRIVSSSNELDTTSTVLTVVTSQITLKRQPELLEEIVHPGTLECRAHVAEELAEMREQLRKQLARIRELRVRKVEEPGALHLS